MAIARRHWGGTLSRETYTILPRLVQVLKEHHITDVMHFAAFAYVGESVQDPLKYYANNVAGTLSLLQAMRTVGVQHLIFSSTCAVYGLPQHPF
jgi:UDP-glucose 4-epimerase